MKMIMTIMPAFFLVLAACSGGSGNLDSDASTTVPITALTITKSDQLIGGNLAHGRIGDIILKNDKIRVIIQQPSKFSQPCPFGGVIIDADIVRPEGEKGRDTFGKMCPLINIEWTVNYQEFQVVSDGTNGSSQVVRAIGTIDVLDYLDLDFIAPVTKALTGQNMYFSPRYDDANDPFNVYEDLRGMNTKVVTEYRLDPGVSHVKMETTYENLGDKPAVFPVGQFVNGSGEVQTLIPGMGFTPPPTAQIAGDATALIYVPFEGVDVSYGYFYDTRQFTSDEVDSVSAQKALTGGNAASAKKRLPSTSLTYSGVTGFILGEEFLKALPLGGPADMKVNFKVPPRGKRVITEYFVVGNGNAGSVWEAGLKAIGIPTHNVGGIVVDEAGSSVKGANVVVQNEQNTTIITFRTDGEGKFAGTLSEGGDSFADAFGNGKYKLFVEKPGYHKEGTNVAGTCDPEKIDVTVIDELGIKCTLGSSGTVEIKGGVKDAASGRSIAARMTVVGFDPSPDSHMGAAYATTHGAGGFEDTWIFERPWGVVDVKYVNAKGGIGLSDSTGFRLEPGNYTLVFSRGTEYDIAVRDINVTGGGVATIDQIKLKKVVSTPGWITGDFHLHSISSPDSSMSQDRRVLAASGEGMDTIMSTDHDWVVDYAPAIEELMSKGFVPSDSITSMMGQEISPNHYGHINAFPLECDKGRIDCGAYDWTDSDFEEIGPGPDYVRSARETIDYFRTGKGGGGEKILQVNHLADQPTSLLIVSSWVTTPAYKGLSPLSSYVEPVSQRIKQDVSTSDIPIPYGESELVITDFDSLELTVGGELYSNRLRETGLPQWFNLLNLGMLVTGTGDSDSHRETVDQIGLPRNYVASNIDPNEGIGSFGEFNKDIFAKAIKEHKVVVSAGPFISMTATGEDGKAVGIGELVKGKRVKFHIETKSPSWAWFDTVEIYANTEPLPADDDGVSVFKGVASDPKSFFMPYHVPKFYYEPTEIFTTSDGSLKGWKEESGVITATVDYEMEVSEDTWVVVFVSGNKGTEGWKSLFPIVTKSVEDPTKMPKPEGGWSFDSLVRDSRMASSAWAFANPIFIDVDGDANGDGNPFEAKYIANGVSPLAK